jgi:hypothetical protein
MKFSKGGLARDSLKDLASLARIPQKWITVLRIEYAQTLPTFSDKVEFGCNLQPAFRYR